MKSKWFKPMELNFATTPTITPDSGSSGTPDTGGGGAGTGSGSGTGGSGTPSAPPSTPQINWDTAPQQFREGYNKLKSDFEKLQGEYKPWQGLNVKPEEVGRFQQGYQQTYGEIKGLADAIGVEEREVADAIRAHGLVPVLRRLELEYQQAAAAQEGDQNALTERDLEDRINSVAERVLSPIQQRENQRVTKEANLLVENTITQLASDAFKAGGMDWAGAPPDLKNFIMTGVTEVLKYDSDALAAIKTEGKTAAVAQAFQTFQSMWDAAYLARRSMEGNRQIARPGQPKLQQQGNQKPPTLEEMINDPNTVRAAQGKPAYST